ncbi:hypothetical protein AAF712_010393 [Marasmius tenuissimus]|uniref:BAR domain-containing protein n=2 Tax=Marasmius tenuissimus TaxID=585030 RepID=A0ABR2ZMX6_9AGAR
MFGAIQMVEYDPSQTDKVVNALHKFVVEANRMLHAGQGMEQWTQTRWADFVMALEWLYDFHPNGKQDLLIDTMKQVKYAGVPWEIVFDTKASSHDFASLRYWTEGHITQNFPTTAIDNLRNPTGYDLSWHGVNLAEGIKALPAAYRFTHNESGKHSEFVVLSPLPLSYSNDVADLTRTSQGWDLLYKYHGRPSGCFGADEYLAGLEATRGTELCSIVVGNKQFGNDVLVRADLSQNVDDPTEYIDSSSYLFQMMGDLKYLDKAERMAYNALPATITADHWAHQYDQQQNQIASRNMTPNPFFVNSAYANVFGLEPYYPCCTVNHPQGWPKFISHAFLTTADGASLVQVYHGPVQVNFTLSGNNKVSVNVETTYPFSDVVRTTVNAGSSYTHRIRVPSWVVNGTVAVNGGAAQALAPRDGFHSITTEARPHGAVAVHRGPLHYALDITYGTTVLKRHPTESRAADFQFDATSDWQFAIDPKTAKWVGGASPDDKLPSPIFDSNKPPVSIEVSGCLIDWQKAGTSFAAPPPTNPACKGQVKTLKLTPYGSLEVLLKFEAQRIAMSWSGFKKSVNRAGTTLLQKTGQIERTVDREFTEEEAKYRTFEKECQALQKDGKTYWDSMRAMTAAQARIAETLEVFYGAADQTSEGAMAAHAYKRSVDDLDGGFGRELDAPYRTAISEPLGKMCAYFPVVNEHIAKRNKKLLDYDAARSKMRKIIDKPSEDPTKMPRAQQEHDEAKEVFELLNDQLIAELPQLLDLRVPYFDPSFEAMIRMQAKFAEEGYEKLSGVQRYFNDSVRDDYAAGQLDAQVEGVLQEMRELSICGA